MSCLSAWLGFLQLVWLALSIGPGIGLGEQVCQSSEKRTYLTQLHMEESVSRLEEVDIGEQSYFMGSLARLGGCAGQGTAHLSPQVGLSKVAGFLPY